MTSMKDIYLNLKQSQELLLASFENTFKRDVFSAINWEYRFSWLIGERGVGKTTLMLQRLKEIKEGLYFSADNPMVKTVGLYQLAHYLYIEKDIRMLYIDEIHKFPDRVGHIKSMYDSLPELKVVFSGSSSLDLFKGVLDLVRRVEFYNIFPMTYREYLKFFHQIDFPAFTLEEILQNHEDISEDYATKHKQTYFEDFIIKGQYPYIKKYEGLDYVSKFQNLMEKVIIEDLPVFVNLQTDSLDKLKRLVYFIANTTPSELSFSSLASKIGVHKSIVENVLTLLSKIWIISLIPKFGNLSDRVRKEYKIFLGNTNLYNAYNLQTDVGILRECFFVSQLKRLKNVELFTPKEGDFIVQRFDKVRHFEIGGKSKQKRNYDEQIYIVKDGITLSEDRRTIPLWLFGLLKE